MNSSSSVTETRRNTGRPPAAHAWPSMSARRSATPARRHADDASEGCGSAGSEGHRRAVGGDLMDRPCTLGEIETAVIATAERIQPKAYHLPTYGHSEDFARPHIETASQGRRLRGGASRRRAGSPNHSVPASARAPAVVEPGLAGSIREGAGRSAGRVGHTAGLRSRAVTAGQRPTQVKGRAAGRRPVTRRASQSSCELSANSGTRLNCCAAGQRP